jgi:hypothetical protein
MQTSINTRVRDTPKSFVGDAEIQPQRKRTRFILEVTSRLDSHLAGSKKKNEFVFVCAGKKEIEENTF